MDQNTGEDIHAFFVSSTFYSSIPTDLRHSKPFFHNIIEHIWYS
jgi:hypothetical protein